MLTSYLLCATPRSGSTLLCGLLKATGVAGLPESYFRQPDEPAWARRWGVTGGYDAYVQAVVAAGTTDNGVFGARLMWGTVDEVVAKLDDAQPGGRAATDLEQLNLAFDQPRFVYLWRDDIVAQAVSWLRAEQTAFWQDGDGTNGLEPRYDRERLRSLVRMIDEHNAAWRAWFAATGVTPHPIRYEDLIADMDRITRDLLAFLGVEAPADHRVGARHRRLGDIGRAHV